MTPEQKARIEIDKKLIASGYSILRGEELDESSEKESPYKNEYAIKKARPNEVAYND